MNMRIPTLTEVYNLLVEAKCPSCGDPNAYVGFSSVECPNPNCKNYKASESHDQSAEVKKNFPKLYKSFFDITKQQSPWLKESDFEWTVTGSSVHVKNKH